MYPYPQAQPAAPAPVAAPPMGLVYYPATAAPAAASAVAAAAPLTTATSGVAVTPIKTAPLVSDDVKDLVDEAEEAIARCHLHTKPQLSCKFCRKYKSFTQQMGVLQQRALAAEEETTKRNMVQMTDATTYNVNQLLRGNIMSSEYFKSLHQLKTFHEVAEEIANYAEHAEPYCLGSTRAPSTLFCCLFKLFTLRLTQKQMHSLLASTASPYVRCTGFLYLRYVHPADLLWKWFEPYFLDDEEFTPGTDKTRVSTIGEYIQSLLTEDKYFSTVLPRLPVLVKNEYGAQLMALPQHRRRKKFNKRHLEAFSTGAKCIALSNGDWLEGAVISLEGDSGVWVRLEDESEELIDIGLVQLLSYKTAGSAGRRALKRDRTDEAKHSRDQRARSRSPDRGGVGASAKTQQDLMLEFRRKEQQKALASGKDYARRPTSYKSALSLKMVSARQMINGASPERSVGSSSGGSRCHPRSSLPPQQQSQQNQQQNQSQRKTNAQRDGQGGSQATDTQSQRMSSLMAKYSRPGGEGEQPRRGADSEAPEVMRLG